jgi:hypothetical protein
MNLGQTQSTVPCHRIDTVLDHMGVKIVDYLSVGVEHSERFPEVYELLATAGFEHQGLLFFDEIAVHRHPRYSWQSVPTTNEMHTHEHE